MTVWLPEEKEKRDACLTMCEFNLRREFPCEDLTFSLFQFVGTFCSLLRSLRARIRNQFDHVIKLIV